MMDGWNILIDKDDMETLGQTKAYEKEQDEIKVGDVVSSGCEADIKVGIISGAPADLDTIKEYASIPSREGLLTMLAGGMIQYVKELSIGLNMYAETLEK